MRSTISRIIFQELIIAVHNRAQKNKRQEIWTVKISLNMQL